MNLRSQFWHTAVCQIASVLASIFWPDGTPAYRPDHTVGCGSVAEPCGERVHCDVRGSSGDDADPADGRPPRREPRPPPQGRTLQATGVTDPQRHTGGFNCITPETGYRVAICPRHHY